MLLLNILPHLICVATLLCGIQIFKKNVILLLLYFALFILLQKYGLVIKYLSKACIHKISDIKFTAITSNMLIVHKKVYK